MHSNVIGPSTAPFCDTTSLRSRRLAGATLGVALLLTAASCTEGTLTANGDAGESQERDDTDDAGGNETSEDEPGTLPSRFEWTSTGPLVSAKPDRVHPILSVKDPSVVFFEDRWHIFATTADANGAWSMVYLNFTDWSEAADAEPYFLDQNPALRGYHAAPQIFYFRPQEKWYMTFQSGQPQYTTTDDLSDPESWTQPVDFFPDGEPAVVAENKGAGNWLDFWTICDSDLCHLFFTDDNGQLYRSQTSIDDFPNGFGDPVIAIDGTKETLFEGSATYRAGDTGSYLTLVEAFGSAGERYYRSFVSDTLDGEWAPLADSLANPFAARGNVDFGSDGAWTRDISHGELLRDGYDESLTIDPSNLRFLYQGVDPAKTNVEYFQLPYQLALLTYGDDAPEPVSNDTSENPTDEGTSTSEPVSAPQTLIDVATMAPRFACYQSDKQFLNPPPEDDALCPAAPNPATIEVSGEDGGMPLLRFEIPFTNYNQFVELEWDIPAEYQDLSGKILILPFKVEEPGFSNPMCPGGIRFFVKTGDAYAYGSAPWISAPATTSNLFQEYVLDLEHAELGTGVAALDLTFVRTVGVAIESADCGGAYPPGSEVSDGTEPPSTGIYFIGDITIEDAP